MFHLESKINYLLMKSSQLMQKMHVPTLICAKYNNMHHSIVKHELDPYFKEAFNIFNHSKDIKTSTYIDNKIIWIFWWQGKDNMPNLVKRCINSIIRHSNGYKVILITQDNINKYVELPNYIYNKMNEGKISLTHFSDILRFNLLNNYGGLWIDSTVYFASDLNDNYFNNFYTINVGHDKHHFSITSGKWTSFLIGGNKNKPLFSFMDIFFKYYWKNNSTIIDYFMMDYALNYAYVNNIGNFQYQVDNCDYQPDVFSLMNNINKKFDLNIYNKILKKTSCFKLTYKSNIHVKKGNFAYEFINNRL